MPVTTYYEQDADLSVLKGKTIAVIGYGSQGHAQAQNLRDSGLNVVIGLREGKSLTLLKMTDLKYCLQLEATSRADVVQILLPDETQASVYKNEIEPNLKRRGIALLSRFQRSFRPNRCSKKTAMYCW